MSVVVVLLTVGLATVGLMAALVFALIRHLKLLSESLRRFQNDVTPVLRRMTEDSNRAQTRMQKLSESGARGLGARIRR